MVGLQDLVEKVMILRKAVERASGVEQATGDAMAEKLSRYAELLAAQGSLTTAINYLGNSQEVSLQIGSNYSLGVMIVVIIISDYFSFP